MSELRPFRALRYARPAGPRIAPPYDVIDAELRQQLAAEPENVVHLTLPPGPSGERDYASAARTLADWLRDGVLVRDAEATLYVLLEHTTDGRRRSGFLGLLELADYDERVVLPHERTMAGPKLDRLRLTREVEANLEPLFFLYEDRAAELDALLVRTAWGDALARCTGPDGTELALFALAASDVATVEQFLAPQPLIIADGHHRYETMLRYRDERREAGGSTPDAPHELVLAYVVNAFDPGSRVQSIHRVLRAPEADPAELLRSRGFALEPLDASVDGSALVELLAKRADREHAFVFAARDARRLATRARGDALDVELLHEELLPSLGGELAFDANPARLLRRLLGGEIDLGILMNPLPPADLFRVVQAGRVLPQKSTFFSPKIPSGLVIRDFR